MQTQRVQDIDRRSREEIVRRTLVLWREMRSRSKRLEARCSQSLAPSGQEHVLKTLIMCRARADTALESRLHHIKKVGHLTRRSSMDTITPAVLSLSSSF